MILSIKEEGTVEERAGENPIQGANKTTYSSYYLP